VEFPWVKTLILSQALSYDHLIMNANPTALARLFRFPGYLLWIAIAYGFGLWKLHPLLTGDQKVYLNVVLEMWERNDWIQPWLHEAHNFNKPPFLYWMVLASWKFFGLSWFSTHLPGVLALLGTCYFLGKIGEEYKVSPAENVAPLAFAGCFGTFTYALSIQMEIWLVLLITGAWYAWMQFEKKRSLLWGLMTFSWAGMLCVVKSPLHFVLWLGGLLLYLVFSGKFSYLRSLRAWFCLMVGTLIGLTWYGIIFVEDPVEFTTQYLKNENLAKATVGGGSLLNMWFDTVVSWMPISLLLIWAILKLGTLLWAFMVDHRRRYAMVLGWSLPPILFFSIFPYRTETYLFIILPGLCLLLNEWHWNKPILFGHRMLLVAMAIAGLAAGISSGMAGLIAWEAVAFLLVAIGFYLWRFWSGKLLSGLVAFQAVLLGVHIACNDIAISDFADLVARVHAKSPKALVILDEGKGWWNERGVLATAMAMPVSRVYSREVFRQKIAEGEMGVLNNSQAEAMKFQLHEILPNLEKTSWGRWNRAFTLPTPAYMKRLADRGSEEWNRIYRREYLLLEKGR